MVSFFINLLKSWNEFAIYFLLPKSFKKLTVILLQVPRIFRAYANFCSMEPQFFNGEKSPFLPRAKVVNPFKDHMMTIFDSYEDFMTFEDYLDMMSVFSENAPLDLKAEYAFRLYDFDHDDMLSIEDLVNLIKHLKGKRKWRKKI